MSKSRKRKLSLPAAIGQTKTLITEWPGKTAILFDGSAQRPKRFTGAHAALDWCKENACAFYCLPPAPVGQN